MPKKVDVSSEVLKDMYEKQELTSFQIAEKIGCCQATIWKRLKEFKIKPRLPGVKRVDISKKELSNLYLKKKFSTWKIERKTGIPRSTIHRKLREFKIESRDLATANTIYPKKDFSGNLNEKYYLIGFRIGDLRVRKKYNNSKTICVACGTTIKEQVDLIRGLFEKYGRVWFKKNKEKTNIEAYLNESFNFLLSKSPPIKLLKAEKKFFPFLAGFIDAEGSIGIYNKRARFSLGNYDWKLLFFIHKKLNDYGIKCNKPFSDKRKGKLNNEGYKYNENYWHLRVEQKNYLLKLLNKIKPHIKHEKKIKSLEKAIINIKDRNGI